jgi:hypothetical protein
MIFHNDSQGDISIFDAVKHQILIANLDILDQKTRTRNF